MKEKKEVGVTSDEPTVLKGCWTLLIVSVLEHMTVANSGGNQLNHQIVLVKAWPPLIVFSMVRGIVAVSIE